MMEETKSPVTHQLNHIVVATKDKNNNGTSADNRRNSFESTYS